MLVLLSTDASGATVDIGSEIRAAICARLGIPDSGEGSGAFWKDDDTLAVQFCGDPTDRGWGYNGCSTWFYNIRTKALSGPLGPGANNGKGRGGTAAFWLGNYGQIPRFQGVYDSNGYNNALAGIADVFANGDVLIIKDYQQQTLGLQRVRGLAVVQDIPTVGQVQGVVARGNVCAWLDFGDRALHAAGAPNPVTVPNKFDHAGPFASDVTGRLWMCDGQNGLMLRAWDVPIGRWLSRDGFNFWQDVVSLPNGKLRVLSSQNQGETEGQQRIWDVDPLTGDYTLNGQAGNAPLVSLIDDSPASLPAPPAPAAAVQTNPSATATALDNEDSTQMLLIIGVLALAWYLLEE